MEALEVVRVFQQGERPYLVQSNEPIKPEDTGQSEGLHDIAVSS